MRRALKNHRALHKELTELRSLFNQLRRRRKFKLTQRISDTKDVSFHFRLYVNIVHLKLIHQIHYLISGINSGNPEAMSVVRSCIETMGALAFITNKIENHISDIELIRDTLYIASMGQNTRTYSKKTVFSRAPQIFHTADYVREANKVLKEMLRNKQREDEEYILESYDFFCEFTHPNYLAFQSYWEAGDGGIRYFKKISCLREDDLQQILLTIIPLILVYEIILRRAEKFEKELTITYHASHINVK